MTHDCDVLLLGGGVGSMTAAIVLADRGLKPLIVEKTDMIGGASAYSGGIVWAPNNHRMKAKGLRDSRAEALAYLHAVSLGRGDRAIAEAYVNGVPRVLLELQNRTALRWVTYPELPDYYAELPGAKRAGRYLLPHEALVGEALTTAAARWPEMSRIRPAIYRQGKERDWVWGRALVGSLWAKLLADDIPRLFLHRATALVRERGTVAGAVLAGPTGERRVVSRYGVVLNTGGFEWNDELTARCVPGPRLHPQTPPGNEGDGHLMAAEVGAAFALMDATIGMPSFCVPGELNVDQQLYRPIFQELALPHAIVVNARGRRFANETFFVHLARGWSELDANCAYSNLPFYFIFDDAYRRKYGFPGGLRPGKTLRQHETIGGLAALLNIDPIGLKDQITAYNAAVAGGLPDGFGRGFTHYQRAFGDPGAHGNPTLGPLESAPFYGVEVHPATSSHRGGVVIDACSRVLDLAGRVIPGLFACGCCAAGSLTGETYFTGTAVGHAIVFGALAAEQIIADSRIER